MTLCIHSQMLSNHLLFVELPITSYIPPAANVVVVVILVICCCRWWL